MKQIQYVQTANYHNVMCITYYYAFIKLLMEIFKRDNRDMYIFEDDGNGYYQIRCSGYSFIDNKLDEETIIMKTELDFCQKFLVKYDDYGDKYVCTFMLPSD